VLQCCDQHSVPGVPHHIPYRTRIGGTNQNKRGNKKPNKIFCSVRGYDTVFPSTSDKIYSAIVKEKIYIPDEPTCFIWATVYHNISTVIKSVGMEICRAMGDWTDENNRTLLFEMEAGDVRTTHPPLLVRKKSPLFTYK